MATRPLLLIAFVLALAVTVALVWNGDPSDPRDGLVADVRPQEAGQGQSAALTAAPAAPVQEGSAKASQATTATEAASRRAGVGLRLSGQVRFEPGVKPGGPVFVWAIDAGDNDLGEQHSSHHGIAVAQNHLGGVPGDLAAHAFAQADGSFSLEFPAEVEGTLHIGALALTAATSEPTRWEADQDTPLVLTLGGAASLTARVAFEAGALAADGFRALEETKVKLRTPREGGDSPWGGQRRRLVDQPIPGGTLDSEGRVTLYGVPIGNTLELTVESSVLPTAKLALEPFALGEHRQVALVMAEGLRVQGTVIDGEGRPIAGALAKAHAAGPFGTPAPGESLRESKTDESGQFDLRGVALSARNIVVSNKGFLTHNERLEDGFQNGALVDVGPVALETGAALVGRVRLADGRVAGGAKLRATVDFTSTDQSAVMGAWRGYASEGESDADGRFRLSGLVGGVRYALTANWGNSTEGYVGVLTKLDENSGAIDLVLQPSPRIQGVVFLADGKPAWGAQVAARLSDGGGNPWMGAGERTTEYADEAGAFVLLLDREGLYEVHARLDGHAPSVEQLIQTPSDAPLELRLRPSYAVRGRVLDPNGQPIEGATVSLSVSGLERMRNRGTTVLEAESDEAGVFALKGVSAGEVVLQARHADYAPSADVAVPVVEDGSSPTVDIVLRRGATIRGVVFNKGERAPAGAQIVANSMPALETRMATTDATGAFVLERLPPGSWQVIAMTIGEREEDSEGFDFAAMMEDMKMHMVETVDGMEYDIELGAPPTNPVRVSGVVRRGDTAVNAGLVSFVPAATGMSGMKFASLDGSGKYEVELPSPGTYLVSATGEGMGGSGMMGSQVELRCEVPEQESFVFDVKLPGGAIKGRVRGPDGKPLSGTVVTWSREDGSALGTMTGGSFGMDSTDEDGNYALDVLTAGRYRIAAGGAGMGAMGGMGDDAAVGGRASRSGIELGADEVIDGVDFDLQTPGEVRGQVRDATGKPVANAAVFVRDAGGAPLSPMSFVQSGSTGAFRMRSLAPGEYTFHARSGDLVSPESARVRVRAGETSEAEVQMAQGAYLTIRIDGEPAPGDGLGFIRLAVHDENDREVSGFFALEDFAKMLSGSSSFDEKRFGPLPPGRYEASAVAPDGRTVKRPVTLTSGQERRLTLRFKD